MDRKLLFKYNEKVLGPDWQKRSPVRLSGWDVVEALHPLNEHFRPHYVEFKALPYNAKYEAQADAAQCRFVFEGRWGPVSAETWRVILERHLQSLLVALANEMEGNPFMPVPEGLPKEARTGAAILFLLQKMKLPFPAADRSGFEPDAARPDLPPKR